MAGAKKFNAADHIPVLVYPNPLNPKRYVVINSGHTFGDKEFRGANALLFPRLLIGIFPPRHDFCLL